MGFDILKAEFNSELTDTGKLLAGLGQHVTSSAGNRTLSKVIVAKESMDVNTKHELNTTFENMLDKLTVVAKESMNTMDLVRNGEGSLVRSRVSPTKAQIRAGAIAGLGAADYKAFMAGKPTDQIVTATESMTIVPVAGNLTGVSQRVYGLEAYDERENKNAALFSIAYNMQAARQNEFGETLFPTITVSPDEVGIGINVSLKLVYDYVERNINGDVQDFKKHNIIRAIADHTILKKLQTTIFPSYIQGTNDDKFVDHTLIAPSTISIEGESRITAPLRIGKKVDIVALSQSTTYLNRGVLDMTDTLDPTISIKNLYIQVGNDILKVRVNNLPGSNFTYVVQGNYRNMALNFDTNSITLNKNTLQHDGTALETLKSILDNDLIVRVNVVASGNANIEFGSLEVFGNKIEVSIVRNSDGVELDRAAAPAAGVYALFEEATFLGYDVDAHVTNVNRRLRGQLIDTNFRSQYYNIPLGSPITAIHPLNSEIDTDASDVDSLVTYTHARTSNDAVTALLNAQQDLKEYVDIRDNVGDAPDVLGIGRYYVLPYYSENTIDLTDTLASISSSGRAEDIQMSIINYIRDETYRMHLASLYKAADEMLSGGVAAPPEVIIATDPYIAGWLMVSGDLRTLGNGFNYRIVDTVDYRMRGKIFITFGKFDSDRNTRPHPLNFGNMLWSPELVLQTPISRNNTINKETVVQPKYRHIVNNPCMAVITVLGIEQVIGKAPINVRITAVDGVVDFNQI